MRCQNELYAHVNGRRDGTPVPDVLPERRVDREDRRPPEERQERREEEDEEVREEPGAWWDGGAVSRESRLEVKEAGDHEDGDDERHEHTCRTPARGRAGCHGKNEENQSSWQRRKVNDRPGCNAGTDQTYPSG